MHEMNLRNQPFDMIHGLINQVPETGSSGPGLVQGSSTYSNENQRTFGPRRVSIDEHATIFGQNNQGFPGHGMTGNVRDVPDDFVGQSSDWSNHDFKNQKPPLPMISKKSEFDSF